MKSRPRLVLFPPVRRASPLVARALFASAVIASGVAQAGLFDHCTVSDSVLYLPSGPFGLFGTLQSEPAPQVVVLPSVHRSAGMAAQGTVPVSPPASSTPPAGRSTPAHPTRPARNSNQERLFDAVVDRDPERVRSLLRSPDVDVNAPFNQTSTRSLIDVAAMYAQPEITRALIEHGARVRAPDGDPATGPLTVHPIAAAFGALKATLERRDAGEGPGDPLGRTPERCAETIRILLEAGADPNDRSPELSPSLPLDALATMPRFEGASGLAILLIERGAVLESAAPPSYPLVSAGYAGREDLVPLFLAARAPAPDTLNRAFLGAASAAHFEVARMLLDAGANPDTPTPLHTPLICDVMSLGHRSLEPLLPLLLAHRANPNVVCQVGTPLTMAQHAALDPAFRLQATQQLLEHGAAVDLPDRTGSTALTLSRPEDHAVVDLLLAHGGHVALAGADLAKYQQFKVDLGPVTWSILEHQDYLAAGLIVRDGPFQEGDCGAVVYSASSGSTLALAELLRRGADPNSRSERGITALMAAVFHGQTGAMQLLLGRRGIDVNETTPVHWDFSIHIEGTHPLRTGSRTALMYAAAGGQVEAIQLLLAHGARADQTDAEGHTALDYARSNPAREVLIAGVRRP